MPAPWRGRVDGEALEVAARAGAPGDGVADDGRSARVDGDAEPGGRAWRASASSRPASSRRQNGGKAAASTARTAGRSAWWPRRSVGGGGSSGGEVVEVAHEQVEALVHLEAGVEERPLLGGGQGGGEGDAVGPRGQLVEARARRRPRVGRPRPGVRWAVVASPRHGAIAQAGVRARQEAVPGHGGHGSGRAPYRAGGVTVLLLTHERYLDHDLGRGHPERPDRLAVGAGRASTAAGLGDGARPGRCPRPATGAELERGPRPRRSWRCIAARRRGGRRLARRRHRDERARPTTRPCSPPGAGPRRRRRARRRRGRRRASAPCARPATTPRPPGRWGSACSTTSRSPPRRWPTGASGCSIVDYDAHHGNGTQDIFWTRPARRLRLVPRVAALPGHRAASARSGAGAGRGTTVNLPLPAGATGDVYRAGVDEVLAPVRGDLRADLAAASRPGSTPTGPTRSPTSACRPATTPTSPPRLLALVPAGPPARVPRGRLRPRRPRARSAAACVGRAARRAPRARAAHERRARARGGRGGRPQCGPSCADVTAEVPSAQAVPM